MNRSSGPFAETSAVVTGASSGIGRAIAIELAKRGVSRCMLQYCNNRSGAEKTAEACQAAGCDAVMHQADLADDSSVDALVDGCFDSLGQIRTWVNNAGLDVLTGEAAQWSFQQKLQRLLRVDLIGTARLSRRVVQEWQRQSWDVPPSMIFMGWDQAPKGMEGDAGQMFGASKAAVMAFASSLSQQVAPEIRVNTVAPGWIRTDWGQQASDYWNDRAKGQSLMGRWGTPEDVAQAVAFLADPGNTFICGQTLCVNGGWSRRFPEP